MKGKTFLGGFLILTLLACQKLTAVKPSNSEDISANSGVAKNEVNDEGERVWIPDTIRKCLSSVNAAEPIEIETNFNPYYLRANLDNNGVVDYVILVHSSKERIRRSILICRDSKEPFLLGPLSRAKEPFSTMNGDNFITNDWEILSNEESRTVTTDSGTKLASSAKGEAIGFFFEGGGFFIYWDGKTFRGVGGV